MIPAEILLDGYRCGIFPMADEDGEIRWFEADPRTILDIHHFRIPHDLRRILNRGLFEIHIDRAFEQVIRACADRESTWISEEIIASYLNLHQLGYAHSVEAWLRPGVILKEGGRPVREEKLAGGLYGVALGAAFFGESMFYRVPHASKVALAHLVEHLRARDFELHDVQMMTPTLKLFGAQQIPKTEYLIRLRKALLKNRNF
ncbi:MAG: leucyl/phenylalanyl-tRNA--protein transferase [candidate division KSB1 bacterium]|nr:leucyl/phenylalanyl-tRNA--protein transferase [candidate division KSB1 bacterium]MDZ7301976.1 leucyl/phenylalanyl-tRNA--protein transferase [candidate division KSB1 bacterium]MDZ7312381.1 leucyl/phenylalanyl-tRNA--protein transferase [candidate division KSB1 bacterium]